MKPNLHLYVFAVSLLTACCVSCASESDEPEEISPIQGRNIEYGDEISFDVSASMATRNGAQPCHFVMSALMKDSNTSSDSYGTIFIDHDVVEDIGTDGEHNWVNNSGKRYWPTVKDATLDFYIHASGFEHAKHRKSASQTAAIEWKDSQDKFSPSLKVFISDECDTQEDLLYATAFNQKRSKDGQAMPLDVDLKRAMTQVLFDACIVNDNLHVEITDISLCGTPLGAYFRFPTSPDDEAEWDIPVHSDNAVAVHMYAGSFDSQGYPVPYTVTKEISGISYETTDGERHPDAGKEMKVIPGNYKRGRYTAGLWSNVYLMLDCTVWNVADKNNFRRDSDVIIVGSRDEESGEPIPATVILPLDWGLATRDNSRDMGKCYIYTITFGKGNFAKSVDGLNIPSLAECSLTITDWME